MFVAETSARSARITVRLRALQAASPDVTTVLAGLLTQEKEENKRQLEWLQAQYEKEREERQQLSKQVVKLVVSGKELDIANIKLLKLEGNLHVRGAWQAIVWRPASYFPGQFFSNLHVRGAWQAVVWPWFFSLLNL